MQHYTVYFSLETVVHVSGGISTHHQKHIQLYLQHLALVNPLLLPVAIVEEFQLLDSRFFVFIKLPEEGTLVSKHVGVGT